MTKTTKELILAHTDGGCTAVFLNGLVIAEANTTPQIHQLVVKAAHQLSNSLGIPVVECTVNVPDELDGKWEWADLYPLLPRDNVPAVQADEMLNPQVSKLDQLKAAFAAATPDWVVVPADDAGNTEGKYIEIHDAYGRTATVYGELDAENVATANLMVLAQNLMPHLLDAVEIVQVNHIGNDHAEALLAALNS